MTRRRRRSRSRSCSIGSTVLAGCARKTTRTAWQSLPLTTAAMFNGVCFTDSHNGWMVGGGWDIPDGIIGRTHDGGETWRFQSGPVPGAHHGFGAIQFLDSLNGCMLGGDGQIFRTIDGGENWQETRGATDMASARCTSSTAGTDGRRARAWCGRRMAASTGRGQCEATRNTVTCPAKASSSSIKIAAGCPGSPR